MGVGEQQRVDHALAALADALGHGGLNIAGIARNDDDILAGTHGRGTDELHLGCLYHKITGLNAPGNTGQLDHADGVCHTVHTSFRQSLAPAGVISVTTPSMLAWMLALRPSGAA